MKMSELSPFSIVSDITTDKKYIFGSETEQHYIPFIINKALSFQVDTLPYVNFLNQYNTLSKTMQHDLLWYSIRKRPRKFFKWPKKEEKNLNIICRLFNCGIKDANEIVKLLTKEQLNTIKNIEETLNNASAKQDKSTTAN